MKARHITSLLAAYALIATVTGPTFAEETEEAERPGTEVVQQVPGNNGNAGEGIDEAAKQNNGKARGERNEEQVTEGFRGLDGRLENLDERLEKVEAGMSQATGIPHWVLAFAVALGIVLAVLLYLAIRKNGMSWDAVQRIENLSLEMLEASLKQPAARPMIDAVSPPAGRSAGGERITIEGQGFDAGAKVYFDGVACKPELVAHNRIIITTPPSADRGQGTVEIIVKTSRGDALTEFPLRDEPLRIDTEELKRTDEWHTIEGSGFVGALKVSFDGKPAPFGVISRTAIVAKLEWQKGATASVIEIQRNGETRTESLRLK